MPRYKNVAGIAREVSKRYLNVDGVAREISKGYTKVDGIAREYFSSGVLWEKYSCRRNLGDYYLEETTGGSGYILGTATFCSEIAYSQTTGISRQGEQITIDPYGRNEDGEYIADPSSVIGMYFVHYSSDKYFEYNDADIVKEIVSYNSGSGPRDVFHYVGHCRAYAPYSYEPVVLQEIVTAPEGELPEDGERYYGSVEDGYVVLKKGNNYYYYILKEE